MPDNEMKVLADAAQEVYNTFANDLAQGYRTKDKEFAVAVLGTAISAWNARAPAQSAGDEEITDEIFLFEVGSAYRRGVEFGPYDDPHSIEPDASEYAALRLKDAREGKSILARAVLTDTAREGEYERGWKAAREACVKALTNRVTLTAVHLIRDLVPTAPSNVGTGEGA